MNLNNQHDLLLTIIFVLAALIGAMIWLIANIRVYLSIKALRIQPGKLDLMRLGPDRIAVLAAHGKRRRQVLQKASVLTALLVLSNAAWAQPATSTGLLAQPGIIITLLLIGIPVLLIIFFLVIRVSSLFSKLKARAKHEKAEELADILQNLDEEEVNACLLRRKQALSYALNNHELAGIEVADDRRGLIAQTNEALPDFFPRKTKSIVREDLAHGSLVLWFLGSALFWLVFGTTVGEYLGIKFVAPDLDHQSWLSFGRLRPVHTNAVFWGWSSLAMLGLGYYVVPRVCSAKLFSVRLGWVSLILINACVVCGSLCLMAGINNGGGEYREYIWPVMALFGAGLATSLVNYIRTVAARSSREIYISNWYIVSAVMFTLVISFIAYWPAWQNGLGETIIQGYYMHQGVGMWFMLFTLGLVYYFLPQQLNRPIYSYSLGILAFWTQILFYTVIGTHHFVFSAIPWWLQTVAIVGSVGMLIPVTAGAVNFFMTFKGNWSRVGNSYTLPFFVAGIVFYFTGSYQGTAEAFRYTNLLWHFTDFTVAHSHLTMYGIIAFLLWGCVYTVVPKITGSAPSQALVGLHFWLALIGLMFYTIPLMIGGTLKGLLWLDGKPFIESVTLMAPYWMWRAIGGTMMWMSHLVFAWNFYRMVKPAVQTDIEALAFEKLRNRLTQIA